MDGISLQDICALNRQLIDEFGGMFLGETNLRDSSGIESFFAMSYYYGDVFDLAAHLLDKIACGHIFNDGNKRTAFASFVLYLRNHGYQVEIPYEFVRELILDLNSHRISPSDIACMLREQLQ